MQAAVEALHVVIPPLYRGARLSHIAAKVREKMSGRLGCVLYGPTGTGKSYASCAWLRQVIIDNPQAPVLRVTWDMLLLQIRQSFKADSRQTELEVLQPYLNACLLSLEDIGATVGIEKAETDFSNRVLMVLLDHRMEQLTPTIITTNKTQESLAKSMNPRITSRLSALSWVGIGGGDKRKANHP